MDIKVIVEEFNKDIADLKTLEAQATRQKSKDLLGAEIRRLAQEVSKLEDQMRQSSSGAGEGAASSMDVDKPAQKQRKYEVKLNNYSWGQSNKFVTFYVTLKNIHNAPKENIKCEFKARSLELKVADLDDKDYVLRINHLLNTINPEQSTWKVKTDMLIVNAAKEKPVDWSHVTEIEKKASEQKAPKMDMENTDPSEGLMSLMKNMYQSGDDEMKRTIAKAWTESQNKNPMF